MTPKPLIERVPDDVEERLSLYPLSFEEALQAALAVHPSKVGTEKATPDGGADGDCS